MMKKILLAALSFSPVLAFFAHDLILAKGEGNLAPVYFTDFEGVKIDASHTADDATGFIWTRNYTNARTIEHKGSNMLYVPIIDSSLEDRYSVVGGFGIGKNGNLSKCLKNESYVCSLYLEMANMSRLFVEFNGGSNWGSFVIEKEGKISGLDGGDNIVDASYANNRLSFRFTMSYNEVEKVNGYLKLTGYDSYGGYLYMDDVKIERSDYALVDPLASCPVGDLKLNTEMKSNYYANTGSGSSSNPIAKILMEGNKKKLEVTKKLTEARELFFLNRLGTLSSGRKYEVSFEMKTLNVSSLALYVGGLWLTDPSYLIIDMNSSSVSSFGSLLKEASYQDGVLSFCYETPKGLAKESWQQFQFIPTPIMASEDTKITMGETRFKAVPVLHTLSLDVSSVKTTYHYGDSFSSAGLKATAIYSDGKSKDVKVEDLVFEGFDSNVVGEETIKVSYQEISATYRIVIKRLVISLELDVSAVKKELEYGEDLDLSKLEVQAHYADGGSSKILNRPLLDGYSLSLGGFDPYKAGSYTVVVAVQEVKATFVVRVLEPKRILEPTWHYTKTGEAK